jgi:hypothetical protein
VRDSADLKAQASAHTPLMSPLLDPVLAAPASPGPAPHLQETPASVRARRGKPSAQDVVDVVGQRRPRDQFEETSGPFVGQAPFFDPYGVMPGSAHVPPGMLIQYHSMAPSLPPGALSMPSPTGMFEPTMGMMPEGFVGMRPDMLQFWQDAPADHGFGSRPDDSHASFSYPYTPLTNTMPGTAPALRIPSEAVPAPMSRQVTGLASQEVRAPSPATLDRSPVFPGAQLPQPLGYESAEAYASRFAQMMFRSAYAAGLAYYSQWQQHRHEGMPEAKRVPFAIGLTSFEPPQPSPGMSPLTLLSNTASADEPGEEATHSDAALAEGSQV